MSDQREPDGEQADYVPAELPGRTSYGSPPESETPPQSEPAAPDAGLAAAASEAEPAAAAKAAEPAADEVDMAAILTEQEEKPQVRRSRRRRVLIVGLVSLLTLAACTVGGALLLFDRADQVQRIPVFDRIPEAQRPVKPTEGPAAKAMNILLAGTDRRSDLATTGEQAEVEAWVPGGQRSDTIILVHLSADRKKAYVVSFPRDSWVEIPGHGYNKINAAFSFGGPSLYVQTMEQLTGIRIDHFAIIDWDGFIGLTDALGGVDVTISQNSYDSANDRSWTVGEHHLGGEDALDYVRQRYGLPRGDFDRVQRQQNFLREIMRKTLSSGTLTNPVRLNNVVNAVTRTVSVDDTLSNADLLSLAISLRGLRQRDVTFMTVPTAGTGYEGSASVVYLDQERAEELFKAIMNDDVVAYLEQFGRSGEQLGELVP